MFARNSFNVIVLCALVGEVTLLDFISKDKLDFPLQVKTKNGVLQGKTILSENGQEFYAFFGIPYGVPPINDLRFRESSLFNKTWSGVLDATKVGKSCIEFLLNNWDVPGDEDCLYLNVYTPQLPQKIGEPLAVMVWFYGGGFREGNSQFVGYGPDYLLTDNVIVVTLNYRVGTLGFLNTEDLESPGNYGLKDQNLALRWVKENIQDFGGNPNKVTIFGESAGSASVAYHLLAERSDGLYQGAILESGTSLSKWAFQTNARKLAFDFGVALGIETKSSEKLMQELRRIHIGKLKLAIPRLFVAHLVDVGRQPTFSPSMEPKHENAFITKHSYTAFQNGNFSKVPIIFGVNTQEANLFHNLLAIGRPIFLIMDLIPQMLATSAMNLKATANKKEFGLSIIDHYFKRGSIAGSDDQELTQYISDDQYVRPITKTVKLTSQSTDVYFYVFGYEGQLGRACINSIFHQNTENLKGSAHSEEIFYLWKIRYANITYVNDNDRYISKMMVRLWTNFAKFGNPTPDQDGILQNIVWPTSNTKNDFAYLYIDQKLKIAQHYRKEDMDFWEDLYNKYSNGPIDIY